MTNAPSHLDRLKHLAKPGSPPPDDPNGPDEEYTSFAAGRMGTKAQLTLMLWRVDGTCHAFEYAHLYSLEYDPKSGIVLHFTQDRVVLTGRHLDGLFRFLTLHRIQAVQQIDSLHAERLPPSAPVVIGIEIKAVRAD